MKHPCIRAIIDETSMHEKYNIIDETSMHQNYNRWNIYASEI